MHWMMRAVAVYTSCLCSQAIAEEQPKARFLDALVTHADRIYGGDYSFP